VGVQRRQRQQYVVRCSTLPAATTRKHSRSLRVSLVLTATKFLEILMHISLGVGFRAV
jgi:hypothetical protein